MGKLKEIAAPDRLARGAKAGKFLVKDLGGYAARMRVALEEILPGKEGKQFFISYDSTGLHVAFPGLVQQAGGRVFLAKKGIRGVRAQDPSRIVSDDVGIAGEPDLLLEAEGGCVSSTEFGRRAGLSRESVNTKSHKHQVFSVKKNSRGLLYPVWQIHDGRLLDEIPAIIAYLNESGETDRDHLRWMLRPNSDLGGKRPLDLLRTRDPQGIKEVVWAAKVLASVRQ